VETPACGLSWWQRLGNCLSNRASVVIQKWEWEDKVSVPYVVYFV
jgi:hypothetical protein